MSETLNIAVVFGGPSAEHEISLLSARNVLRALSKEAESRQGSSYSPLALGITRQREWMLLENWEELLSPPSAPASQAKLPYELKKGLGPELAFLPGAKHPLCIRQKDASLKALEIDLFFPLVHGPYGEDGSLQGFFHHLGIPYLGSDPLASAIAMDKDILKSLLSVRGEGRLHIGEYLSFQKHSFRKGESPHFEDMKRALGLPFYVKPARQGSSVGIHRVKEEAEFSFAVEDAFLYDTKIIIEKNIEGRELECAILGNTNLEASLIGEIIPHKDFYSYEAKYMNEATASLRMPTELSQEEQRRVQESACMVFRLLELKGFARVDMFLDKKGKLWINEVNTIPGFTDISMYPGLWEKSGLSLRRLLDRLIVLAQEEQKEKSAIKLKPS